VPPLEYSSKLKTPLGVVPGNIIPNFAVLEGGDGSGTTTQLSLLTERLKNTEKPVFFPTFEPTDGQIGALIRSALRKELPLNPETLAMLFACDRNEHLYGDDGIIVRVNRGELVVSDRYVCSSLVYQGIECGDELPMALNSRFGIPQVTIFLDVEPEIALARVNKRKTLDIYEYREFQEKVRDRYRAVLDNYSSMGARVETIDASKSIEEVSDQVWSIISSLPIFKL
jgi:dTMP kinase